MSLIALLSAVSRLVVQRQTLTVSSYVLAGQAQARATQPGLLRIKTYHAASAGLLIGMRRLQKLRAVGMVALSAMTTAQAAEAGQTVPVSTVDVSAFRRAMGSFPTGVTIVTVASDDSNMHGITVSSFSSVSLDPMLVLVCLNETSRGVSLIERAGAFVVNVLSARQQDVSRWFANQDRPVDSTMFDGLPFEPGVTGCPVLVDATASFECRLRQSHRAGDHLIMLGEVIALMHRPQLEPLIFHAGSYKSLQHEQRSPCTTG